MHLGAKARVELTLLAAPGQRLSSALFWPGVPAAIELPEDYFVFHLAGVPKSRFPEDVSGQLAYSYCRSVYGPKYKSLAERPVLHDACARAELSACLQHGKRELGNDACLQTIVTVEQVADCVGAEWPEKTCVVRVACAHHVIAMTLLTSFLPDATYGNKLGRRTLFFYDKNHAQVRVVTMPGLVPVNTSAAAHVLAQLPCAGGVERIDINIDPALNNRAPGQYTLVANVIPERALAGGAARGNGVTLRCESGVQDLLLHHYALGSGVSFQRRVSVPNQPLVPGKKRLRPEGRKPKAAKRARTDIRDYFK